MLEYMSIVWIVLLVVFIIVEVLTEQLVALWCIIGSFVALLLAFFGMSIGVQIALFLVVSIVSLLILRPILSKKMKVSIVPTNADMNIGKTGVVITEIDNDAGEGRISINGLTWAAVSANDQEIIPAGSKVKILSLSGVKFTVQSIN